MKEKNVFNEVSFSIVHLYVGSLARQVKCTMLQYYCFLCLKDLLDGSVDSLLGLRLNTLHKCE